LKKEGTIKKVVQNLRRAVTVLRALRKIEAILRK